MSALRWTEPSMPSLPSARHSCSLSRQDRTMPEPNLNGFAAAFAHRDSEDIRPVGCGVGEQKW
jgi:hypothetical protein